MRKITTLAIIVAAIMAISAAAVFSHPGWRGARPWGKAEGEQVTLEGKITDAERPLVKMEAEGKEYIFHPGPFWYWEEKEYTLEKDQSVKVTGVVEEIEGELHLYPYTIEADGKLIELVDEDGVPVWAGHRGGRGPKFGRCGDDSGYGGRGYMHGRARRGAGQARGRGGYGRGCGR